MGCCLRPPYAAMEPGWNDGFPTTPLPVVADQWNESINFRIPQATFLVTVPFQTAKASANLIDHGLQIYNSVDAEQVILSFNIVETTITGFTIMLNQQVDTDNYYLRGLMSVIA
jgi:hypothetical protein